MLKLSFVVSLLLSATFAASAKPLQGPYTASFFGDPGSVPGSQICFDLSVSNGIAGFPQSGTFVDTDGYGISGQYVVDKKFVHLIMLVTGFGDNVDMIGPKKGTGVAGNYDDFDSGYNGGGNSDISSGTFTLIPGCTTDAASRRHPNHKSVTR